MDQFPMASPLRPCLQVLLELGFLFEYSREDEIPGLSVELRHEVGGALEARNYLLAL